MLVAPSPVGLPIVFIHTIEVAVVAMIITDPDLESSVFVGIPVMVVIMILIVIHAFMMLVIGA